MINVGLHEQFTSGKRLEASEGSLREIQVKEFSRQGNELE